MDVPPSVTQMIPPSANAIPVGAERPSIKIVDRSVRVFILNMDVPLATSTDPAGSIATAFGARICKIAKASPVLQL
jgi:hypothetical protein